MKAGLYNLKKLIAIGSASVFTVLAVPLMSDVAFDGNASFVATAHAEEDGSGKKGPSFKGGGTDRTRGKPAWAQEGVPSDVELGRLNVARAPGQVMDKQLVEALASLKTIVAADGVSIYEATTYTEAISLIVADALRIDSPLANLALIKDFLTGGIDGFLPTMTSEEFVSVLLAGASDKTVPITVNTVKAIETILGLDLGDDAAVAQMADDVREAILFAHDN